MAAWNLRPIASALWRNRTGAILVAFQIAIGLAVLVNAVYVVKQRVELIGRPTGMDTANMIWVSSAGFAQDFDYDASWREDIAALRGDPGRQGGQPHQQHPALRRRQLERLPGEAGRADAGRDRPGQHLRGRRAGRRGAGHQAFFGAQFRGERDPAGDRNVRWRAAGDRDQGFLLTKCSPDDPNPVGKSFYDGLGNPTVVIGIIEHMHGAWVGWDKLDHVMLYPRIKKGPSAVYVVRTEPGRRDAVMREIEAKLGDSTPGRLLRWVRPFDYFIDQSYLGDRNMAIFLVSVTSALLAITALGIFGLATFNVSTRIRQIGTRRAVGARRMDIVRHFLVENWMVTTAGVVAGCGAALGIGYWISVKYELPRLDLYYLVGGILVIWLIGLAAALQPARRASAISPAVASRTV